MKFGVFGDVEEGFFEVVGDLGGEGYACYGYACDAGDVFGSDFTDDMLGIVVDDIFVGVWEAWDYAEVDVVGADFAVGEFEVAELDGVDFGEDFCHFGFFVFGHVFTSGLVTW